VNNVKMPSGPQEWFFSTKQT